MAEGKLYFAYGSNINLDQMAQRCPDAQVVGPVTLENYELLFHGNLRGAGVATIAPREGSTVHGLLWNITPECERSLDYYEGYPHLYGKEPVTVHGHDGQEHTVMAYVMTELCKEPSTAHSIAQAGVGALCGGGSPGDRADQPQRLRPALVQTEERPRAINLKSVRRQNLCQTKAFPYLGKYISAQNRFIPP